MSDTVSKKPYKQGNHNPPPKQPRSLRARVYHLLEAEHDRNDVGRYLDWFLIALIIVNVHAVVLESYQPFEMQYKTAFLWFERFSITIFSIEFLARLWCIPERRQHATKSMHGKTDTQLRLRWLRTPIALIDLIAILPALLQFLFAIDLRMLRLLRLLRILKLSRYSESLRILLRVLGRESNSLQAMAFIMAIMVLIASSGMYFVEHKVQPEHFGSIPQAMWWAVVTLTTVGYGDVTPITPLGKVFGACITMIGIGIAALPAGILASGFASELADRRQEMEFKFRSHLLSGDIDLNHRNKIEELRKDIGLSKKLANDIVIEMLRDYKLSERERALKGRHTNQCPRCGYKHDVDM